MNWPGLSLNLGLIFSLILGSSLATQNTWLLKTTICKFLERKLKLTSREDMEGREKNHMRERERWIDSESKILLFSSLYILLHH